MCDRNSAAALNYNGAEGRRLAEALPTSFQPGRAKLCRLREEKKRVIETLPPSSSSFGSGRTSADSGWRTERKKIVGPLPTSSCCSWRMKVEEALPTRPWGKRNTADLTLSIPRLLMVEAVPTRCGGKRAIEALPTSSYLPSSAGSGV